MYLKTFGELGLISEPDTDLKTQKAIKKLQPKELILLSYIALEGKQGIDRERLRKLFVPNKKPDGLRVAIKRLKDTTTIEISKNNSVCLSRHLRVDVYELEQYLSEFKFEQASGFCQGYEDGFLQGYEEKYDSELCQWIEAKQLEYARKFCNIKLYLAGQCLVGAETNLATVLTNEAVDIAFNMPFVATQEDFLLKVASRALDILQQSGNDRYIRELKKMLNEADIDISSYDGLKQVYLYGDMKYQGAPFSGRVKEMAQAISSLFNPDIKSLQIVGPPLFGKSALCQKIAEMYFRIYPYGTRFNRALFVNLEKTQFTSFDEILRFIFESLPVSTDIKRQQALLLRVAQPIPMFRRLLKQLEQEGGILFVLDGFEKVLDEKGKLSKGVATFIDVVSESDKSAILISTRKELGGLSAKHSDVIWLNQGLELEPFIQLWENFPLKESLNLKEALPFSTYRLWELCFGIPRMATQLARLLFQHPELLARPQALEQQIIEMSHYPAKELFEQLSSKEQHLLKLLGVCREFATVDLMAKILKQWHVKVSPHEVRLLLNKLAAEHVLEIDANGSLTLHDLYCQKALNLVSKQEWQDLIRILIDIHEAQKISPEKKQYLRELVFDIGLVKLLKPHYPTETAIVLARFMMFGLYRLNYNRLIIQLVTDLPERVEDTILKGRCYNWLGLAYGSFGQYETAASQFETALKFLKSDTKAIELGYTAGISGNLAEIHTLLGNFRQAIRLHIFSFRSAIRRDRLDAVVVGLTWMGEVFEKMNRYRWAKRCYLEAKRLYPTVPAEFLDSIDAHFEVYRLLGLARLAQRDDDLGASKKYFEVALKLATELGDNAVTADVLLQCAKVLPYLESRQSDLLRAEELYRNTGRLVREKETLELLESLPEHQDRARARLAFLESLS